MLKALFPGKEAYADSHGIRLPVEGIDTSPKNWTIQKVRSGQFPYYPLEGSNHEKELYPGADRRHPAFGRKWYFRGRRLPQTRYYRADFLPLETQVRGYGRHGCPAAQTT